MLWPFPSRMEPIADTALDQLDDTGLIARARRRDDSAFAVLYHRHVERVYRYIACRTMQQNVAEDLTAEVFLNAWKSVDRYQERGYTVRTWLLRLAHNEVIDHYRTHRPSSSLDGDSERLISSSEPDSISLLNADHRALIGAVRQLSTEWQQVILLRFVEELSFDEVGVIIGKRSGACRQIQHRALARLRELLANEKTSYDY